MVAAVPDARRRSSHGSTSGQTIVLVEDNRDIAMALGWLLRARGHVVEVAYDGRSALAIARRFRPGFALLDLDLPEMDGYELAARLRAQLGRSAPVLVAVPGPRPDSGLQRARRARVREHLGEPHGLGPPPPSLRGA